MIGEDLYYSRQEVSNSDLTELWKYFLPFEVVRDLTAAYRFGNLVDAMITEGDRCDHIRRMVDGEQFTEEEWNTSYDMLNAFRKDPLCSQLHKLSIGQKVFSSDDHRMEFDGIEFSLAMRCKYDGHVPAMGFGYDIKSTIATTESQFRAAFDYMDYGRSRALYMDLSGADKDLVIGISKKKPHKIFKIFINRGDDIYTAGKARYQEMAFKWWSLFGEVRKEELV